MGSLVGSPSPRFSDLLGERTAETCHRNRLLSKQGWAEAVSAGSRGPLSEEAHGSCFMPPVGHTRTVPAREA